MTNKLFFGSALVALCGLAVGPVCVTHVQAAEAATTTAGRSPLDYARASAGAQLQTRDAGANAAAQSLISDDVTANYALPSGTTSVILTLSKIELLNLLSFSNAGATGKVTVSVSSTKLPFDSAAWRSAGSVAKFDGAGTVNCDLGSVEARYVKVDFSADAAGHIGNLSVTGLPTFGGTQKATNAYVATPAADSVALSVSLNFVNLAPGAKVVGISKASSLGNVQTLQSGNPEAAYTFDPTDARPTLVVDLGSHQSPEAVTCAYKAPAGRLDLYLVDSPEVRADRAVSLNYVSAPTVQPVANDRATAQREPVGSVTTAGEGNVARLAAKLHGQSGRYLIAEFHPVKDGARTARRSGDYKDTKDFKNAGVRSGDYKDLKDAPVAGITDAPVAGISTFGDPSAAQAIPLLPPLGVTTP